ncbi:MAG TPA: hypothetical protein VGW10_16200, partial [Solirubrobacteraceae bacterium]|nr:hypothetical protein [Solirubrobacteraceae bacterium]
MAALLTAIAPAPAAAEDPGPNVSVTWPETYMPITPTVSGRTDVSGEVVSEVTVQIRDVHGVLMAETHAHSDYGMWMARYPPNAEPLVHGEQYDISVWQRYSDGSRGATRRGIADGRYPVFTVAEQPPDESHERMVRIAGTVDVQPGDLDYVYVHLRRLGNQEWWKDPYAELPIEDGRFSGTFGPVEPGEYQQIVGMADRAYQGTEVKRGFRVLAPPDPPPPPAPPPPEPASLPLPPPLPVVPSEQVVETVAETRQAAIGTLRRGGLRTLQDGSVRVPVDVEVPGRLTVELFTAGSTARAAAARRALARGVRTLTRAGRAGLTLRVD